MVFRKATVEDADLLLRWRNDPETRAASRNMEMIEFDDHVKWLNQVLADPHRHLFVVDVDGEPIGTIRADDGPDDATELCWTVAPEAREQGYGKRMLGEFLKHPGLAGKKVWAEIKTDNPASAKMVSDSGFRLVREHDGLQRWQID